MKNKYCERSQVKSRNACEPWYVIPCVATVSGPECAVVPALRAQELRALLAWGLNICEKQGPLETKPLQLDATGKFQGFTPGKYGVS